MFVAGFGALMAVLGVLNLTISYIGGAVWTYVAFGGAAAAGLAARDLRKLARRIEQSADHPADSSWRRRGGRAPTAGPSYSGITT